MSRFSVIGVVGVVRGRGRAHHMMMRMLSRWWRPRRHRHRVILTRSRLGWRVRGMLGSVMRGMHRSRDRLLHRSMFIVRRLRRRSLSRMWWVWWRRHVVMRRWAL